MNENGTTQWIYYTGSNNEICLWGASAPKWEYTNYCPGGGQAVAPGTSPTTSREASTGTQWIHYVGSNGEVCWWGTSAPKWEYTNYCPGGGQAAEQGTTPSAIMNENGTTQWIYYTGSNNEICLWGASAPKWEYTNYCPGGGIKTASGTNPTAIRETSGGTQWIYYVGGNGKVCWWGTSAPKWEYTNYCPGGGQAAF
jgi:hypothetical protein